MMKRFISVLTLVLLAIVFLSVVVINNELLGEFRVDLTEERVYTLSEGSQRVINDIDEPIVLYFFFSDSSSKGMTLLRNYASRVQSLLTEYTSRSNGKITLKVIDPEPFSAAEDLAAQYGLTGATLGPIGEAIYFGLAGTNAVDSQYSISFFDPQKESFLEYDVSKLIYQLSEPESAKLTILTDVNLLGGQDPMSGQALPPMAIYDQLSQLYDIQIIGSDALQIPADTDVLIVVHPRNLGESLAYSIDQFAMRQGRIFAFLDPHFESDDMSVMGGLSANSSDVSLFSNWGVNVAMDQVILDPQLGLDIRTPTGEVVRHSGILGIATAQLNREDVVTANLELINGSSFAPIDTAEGSDLRLTPLAFSTKSAVLMSANDYAMTRDPNALQDHLTSENTQQFTIAARISGNAKSAFEQAPEMPEGGGTLGQAHVSQTNQLNLIIISDADLLADRFWVQQANFFGEVIVTPFANNGDFIINASDNLAGSDALINVRGRGTFARPFERVQAIQAAAEARFREQEERLQEKLQQTEEQLAQLQAAQPDSGSLTVTPAQQSALDEFVAQRADIRRKLRDVRYQLDRDIDQLGNYLKIFNIAVMPVSLVTLLWVVARLVRRRASRKKVEALSL